MESCFPPLASLSLRGNSANSSSTTAAVAAATNNKHQKNRHSLGGGAGMASSNGSGVEGDNGSRNNNHSDYLPKLDVIQDLDLYYIRQIACSLKVSIPSC